MRKTIDAPPQGDHDLVREAGPQDRFSGKRRSGRGPAGQREELQRQVRLVAACLLDVSRLLKQEGWIDILDDEFGFSDGSEAT